MGKISKVNSERHIIIVDNGSEAYGVELKETTRKQERASSGKWVLALIGTVAFFCVAIWWLFRCYENHYHVMESCFGVFGALACVIIVLKCLLESRGIVFDDDTEDQ